VVLLLAAAIFVLILGPGQEEGPAFVVIAVVLAVLCVRISPPWTRSARGLGQPSLEERREDFHPRERDSDADEPGADGAAREAAWARERERYRQGE
jgi:hypothetical protein